MSLDHDVQEHACDVVRAVMAAVRCGDRHRLPLIFVALQCLSLAMIRR